MTSIIHPPNIATIPQVGVFMAFYPIIFNQWSKNRHPLLVLHKTMPTFLLFLSQGSFFFFLPSYEDGLACACPSSWFTNSMVGESESGFCATSPARLPKILRLKFLVKNSSAGRPYHMIHSFRLPS
jgi:hypothetical protein